MDGVKIHVAMLVRKRTMIKNQVIVMIMMVRAPGYGLFHLMAKANPKLIISMSGKGHKKRKRAQGSTGGSGK